jgi:hypothetical protein
MGIRRVVVESMETPDNACRYTIRNALSYECNYCTAYVKASPDKLKGQHSGDRVGYMNKIGDVTDGVPQESSAAVDGQIFRWVSLPDGVQLRGASIPLTLHISDTGEKLFLEDVGSVWEAVERLLSRAGMRLAACTEG